MNDYPELSEMHLDALREISNIGMGNAVTALAQLVNRRIDMKVPRAQFMPFEETIALVGGLEEEVACVSLRILGDVLGTVLFIFNGDSARQLVDLLMGLPPGTTVELDEIGQSAVKEIGNLLTGAFINALSQLTMLNMITTVPMFAMDMLGAVVADLMIASGRVEDNVLVIGTDLVHEEDTVINGHFFLLTDPGAIDKLFAALGLA